MTVRVYRTLLLLYPKSFRLAYGEDMVAVFEEMRRDRSAAALWWRVINDACKSVIVQRLETLMSKGSTLRPVLFAAVALVTLIVAAARGVTNVAVFATVILLAGVSCLAALVYWEAHRSYVEPSDQLHRYWWRPLAAGTALIAVANVGSGFDLEVPWLVLFTTIITGIVLIAVGFVLGLMHGLQRVRAN